MMTTKGFDCVVMSAWKDRQHLWKLHDDVASLHHGVAEDVQDQQVLAMKQTDLCSLNMSDDDDYELVWLMIQEIWLLLILLTIDEKLNL